MSAPLNHARNLRAHLGGAAMQAVLLFLSLISVSVAATGTPEQNARAFLDAVAAKDWTGAAKLYHPESSARLKASIWPAIAGEMNCGHPKYFRQVLGDKANYGAIASADPYPFAAAVLERLLGHAAQPGLFLSNGRIVGSIDEGETLRHILVRTEIGTVGFKLERMSVLTFERMVGPAPESRWGLLVGTELQSFVYRLRQSFRPECK